MEDRKKYIDKMSAKLKEWDAEIQKLEAKADSAKADVKARYSKQIVDLRNKKDEAQQKLNQLQQASEDAWEELKDGIEKSWGTLGDSIKKAYSKLR
jgi:uncharacterized coiled-coil DUF342 family protein